MSKELFTDPRWTEIPAFKVVGKAPERSKEERIATKRKFLAHLTKIGVLTEEERVERLEEYIKRINELDE